MQPAVVTHSQISTPTSHEINSCNIPPVEGAVKAEVEPTRARAATIFIMVQERGVVCCGGRPNLAFGGLVQQVSIDDK